MTLTDYSYGSYADSGLFRLKQRQRTGFKRGARCQDVIYQQDMFATHSLRVNDLEGLFHIFDPFLTALLRLALGIAEAP